jgi:hypothetical protein
LAEKVAKRQSLNPIAVPSTAQPAWPFMFNHIALSLEASRFGTTRLAGASFGLVWRF